MLDDKDLGSVPDTALLTLFKGLVEFLKAEAENRGWSDITRNLHDVEAALTARNAPAHQK